MMRSGDVAPSGPPSTLKRPRPEDESSTVNDPSKIPRVEENRVGLESSYMPQNMPTLLEDIAPHSPAMLMSVPASSAITGTSVHIAEASEPFMGSFDDGQVFLTRLLSMDVESESVMSQNPLGISSETWTSTE